MTFVGTDIHHVCIYPVVNFLKRCKLYAAYIQEDNPRDNLETVGPATHRLS